MRPIAVFDRILAQVPSLRRFARALLQDPDTADQLVADVLLQATTSRGFAREMTVRAALYAKLYEAVLARCGDAVNGHAWISGAEQREPRWPAGADAGDANAVKRALAQLPAEERALLLLVYLEGFSPAEVAAITGLAPEAARACLVRSQSTIAWAFARTRMAKLIGLSVLFLIQLPLAA